jgi:DNA mismatch repair ATPase MutS
VFLDKLLLLDTALPVSSFEFCDGISFDARNKSMLIDAQAIEHLDILPLNRETKSAQLDGSLLGYLSAGSRTAFGKRMLKRWIVSPLTDKD